MISKYSKVYYERETIICRHQFGAKKLGADFQSWPVVFAEFYLSWRCLGQKNLRVSDARLVFLATLFGHKWMLNSFILLLLCSIKISSVHLEVS